MKELFGVDLTEDKLNAKCDGEAASSRQPSDDLRKKMLLCGEQQLSQAQRVRLGGFLASIRNIALLAFIVCTIISLFAEGAQKHIIGWSGILLGAGAAALTLFEMIRASKYKRSVQARALDRVSCICENAAYFELGVPTDSVRTDVFAYEYRVNAKKGTTKLDQSAGVVSMPVYLSGDVSKFSIYDGERCYDVPREGLLGIVKEESKLNVYGYNRDEKFREENYPVKIWRMRFDERTGMLTTRFHYKLIFRLPQGDFCLRFPPYELDSFERYTGLKYVEGAVLNIEAPTENNVTEKQ